jgi:hypothetical protein
LESAERREQHREPASSIASAACAGKYAAAAHHLVCHVFLVQCQPGAVRERAEAVAKEEQAGRQLLARRRLREPAPAQSACSNLQHLLARARRDQMHTDGDAVRREAMQREHGAHRSPSLPFC